jgi:hypothetical protein
MIRPLDCIFFKGNEEVSEAIVDLEKLTMGIGEWSHIGIVVNKDIIPSLNIKDNNELYIWESTLSSSNKLLSKDPTLDAESNKAVFGVQIRNLKDVINNNLKDKVKLGWGKLKNNPIDKMSEEDDVNYQNRLSILKSLLSKIHQDNYHKPYTMNVFRLFSAMFNCCGCLRSSCCIGEDWRFCSQLVSMVYQEIGVLSKSFDNEVILPQDLATPQFSEENLPTILEDVIEIKTQRN